MSGKIQRAEIITTESVVSELMQLEVQLERFRKQAEGAMKDAFLNRWNFGRIVDYNYELLISEYGTQKKLASALGVSESTVSNNLRAFRTIRDTYSCDTPEQVLSLMASRGIQTTTRNFEKIGSLLATPQSGVAQKEQRPKDERRLAEIQEEIMDIVRRNETDKHNMTYELAVDTMQIASDATEHIQRFDPYKMQWENRRYLDWVKSLGVDMVTGARATSVDPHHTLPDGSSGGTAMKPSDVFVIPVTRETHELIENGMIELSREEILEMLVKLQSLFIMTHFK